MLNNRITLLGLGVVIALAIVTGMVVIVIVDNVFLNDQEPSPVEKNANADVDITARAPNIILLPTAEILVEGMEDGEEGSDAIDDESFEEGDGQIFDERPPETATVLSETGKSETRVLIHHRVSEGETLYRISINYGVPMDSILNTNGIADPWLIQTGQILVIPSTPIAYMPPTNEAIAAVVSSPTPDSTPTLIPTVTPEETAAVVPTSTPTEAVVVIPPTETLRPTDTNIPMPPFVDQVNGIPVQHIVVMPDNVRQRAREIFESGQQQGRNPRAFSKIGDSTIENPHFLTRFDEGPYDLGIYGYLQPVIDYFAGSYSRQGVAVRRGFHSWSVTDPMWADKEVCEPNETPIACEIRIHNPSIIFIRLGSNDRGVPAGFDQNVRLIVEYAIEKGVLPVIGTKADRFEGDSNINNILLRQIAADYALPLWDFDLVAGTLPGRGLYIDDVHLTIYYAHDYTSPVALQRGHSVHNLTALMVLDRIWKEVIQTGG